MKFRVGFIFSYILILSVFQLNSVAFKFSARLPANYQDEEVMNSILDNDVRNAHQKLDALIQLKKKLESLCKIVPSLGVCRTVSMKKRGIKDLMYMVDEVPLPMVYDRNLNDDARSLASLI